MVLRLKNVITRRTAILTLSLLCGLMATACSMTSVGYSLAPRLANWEIAKFVTFAPAQQALADQRLARLHEWHRSTQIPDYVGWLDQMVARLEPLSRLPDHETVNPMSTPDAAELAAWRAQVTARLEPLWQQLAEPLAQLALTLTAEQLADIEAQLQVRNQALQDRTKPSDPLRAAQARLERWRSRLEFFLGPLTEKQQARLAHWLETQEPSAHWWANRLARQQRMLALLHDTRQQQPPVAQVTPAVLRLLRDIGEPADPQVAARRQQRMAQSDQMLAELLAIGTPRQFRHARDRFAGFAADLRAIGDLPDRAAGAATDSTAAAIRRLAMR